MCAGLQGAHDTGDARAMEFYGYDEPQAVIPHIDVALSGTSSSRILTRSLAP